MCLRINEHDVSLSRVFSPCGTPPAANSECLALLGLEAVGKHNQTHYCGDAYMLTRHFYSFHPILSVSSLGDVLKAMKYSIDQLE